VKYLHVVAHAARSGRGAGLEYIGAVRDVTERKLSEDALHQARAELAHVARVTTLGQLTASIAHELNQPLAGIVTNANACLRLLAETPPNLSAATGTAKRSIRDATRAADVIARLRDLFRKRSPAREPFDLNGAVREVAALTRRDFQRIRAVLRLDMATGLPRPVGDRVQLQQVMLNLILNALDAMSGIDDRAREIAVSAACEQDQIHVAVQDSGSGFEPECKERIFEPFYSTKTDGMGMGLSISRSIVENHGGRLWAVLNHGPGATFHFTLPREAAPVPA
jgi:C4-dicarboxylate-specific signal transduction histidine kinase